MTMFDYRLQKTINSFGENWNSDEQRFRSTVSFAPDPEDSIVIKARANGRSISILTMTRGEYESWIRKPIASARCGESYGQRYFAWHLLGEKNLQQTYLTKLKELQNA